MTAWREGPAREGAGRTLVSLNEDLRDLRVRILKWAAGWGLRTDDAQDLAQDVLLKVVRNLDEFRGESRVSSWVYRIALNEQVSQARRSMLRLKVEGGFASTRPASEDSCDKAVLRALDARRQVDALLRRGILSAADLSLFEMVAVEGLSSVEAGARLGVPPGTIRSRLSKTAARIQREVHAHIVFRARDTQAAPGTGQGTVCPARRAS